MPKIVIINESETAAKTSSSTSTSTSACASSSPSSSSPSSDNESVSSTTSLSSPTQLLSSSLSTPTQPLLPPPLLLGSPPAPPRLPEQDRQQRPQSFNLDSRRPLEATQRIATSRGRSHKEINLPPPQPLPRQVPPPRLIPRHDNQYVPHLDSMLHGVTQAKRRMHTPRHNYSKVDCKAIIITAIILGIICLVGVIVLASQGT